MTVKIVTDSTSDLPPDLARDLDITVVPLNVHFGTQVFKDGVDLLPDEFYKRLVDGSELPKTSQPSPGEFLDVYERLGQDADGILSVHISSKLSGTFNSAVQARGQTESKCPIEILDTRQASMGSGMVAIAAARSAAEGASIDEVTRVARQSIERCEFFVLLETLEYLQKGGRIGKARALLGTLLNIRPMIVLRDGEVHEFGKERTRARGVAKLQSTAREFAPLKELCVLHSTTSDEAQALADSLSDLLPGGIAPVIARAGPVIGTYAGPGCLAIALLRSDASP